MKQISKNEALMSFGIVVEDPNLVLVREDGTYVVLEGSATDWMGM